MNVQIPLKKRKFHLKLEVYLNYEFELPHVDCAVQVRKTYDL